VIWWYAYIDDSGDIIGDKRFAIIDG